MKKLKIINWYIIALLLAAISAVSLRTYALLTSFNPLTMYFENSTAIKIANWIVVAGVLLFMTYVIFGEKKCDLIAKTDNAATYIPSGIVCVALIFMGIERLQNIPAATPENQIFRALSIITPIFALISVVSLFVSIFFERKHSLYKAAFSLSIIFFLALYASYLFFNVDPYPTNAPNLVVDQMTYLFAAVFFLNETRVYLGRAKWRLYVAFGLSATLLSLYSSIPALICYVNDGYVASTSITESVLSLTLAVYIASKVLQSKSLTPNVECEVAKSISALAAFREEEIVEQRKLSRAQEDNKVEIEETKDASNYTFDIPYIDPTVDLNPDGADIEISKESND